MHELTRARAKVKSAVLASLGVHSRSWLGWVATAGGLFLLAVVLGCDDNPSSELNLPVLQVGPEQAVAPRFDNVVSIDRLTNGTLVVADEGTASITYVAAEGNQLSRIGRKGQGPGEFQTLRNARRCLGDTVAVSDYGSGHLSLIAQAGFVRHVALPASVHLGDLVGCVARGAAIYSRFPALMPGVGTQWFSISLFSFDFDTGRLDWIGVLRGTEMSVSQTASAFFEKPFGVQTLFGVTDSMVIVGQTDEPFVRLLDLAGTARIVPLPAMAQRKVSSRDKQRLTEERLADEGNPVARKDLAIVLSEAEWGVRQPRYDRLVAQRDGAAWFRTPPEPSDSTAQWIRVGADGCAVGTVRIAVGTQVMFADSAHVIGIRTEANGAQRVVLYSLR